MATTRIDQILDEDGVVIWSRFTDTKKPEGMGSAPKPIDNHLINCYS